MSISKAASFRDTSGDFCCPRCGTPLLPHAAFCSSCGERLDNNKSSSSLIHNEQDISTRYRISSLVRRRPYVTLYFALDNQQSRQGQQRMVAIRDIDLTSLNEEARMHAIKLVQQEYDALRIWQIPYVLPMIDLQYSKGHLYAISGYPLAHSSASSIGKNAHLHSSTTNVLRLYTLQDFLQSGHGLPSEQQAQKWMQNLCQALDGLHQHHIVVGELDPYTIILNENSVNAKPALMISWLSPQLQKRFRSSEASTRFWSYFSAPEALEGKAEPRSDIYSLGAVLYLLLSGSLPSERVLRSKGRLRSPHELNSRISLHISDCVMQALDNEPSKRFQSAQEMSKALSNPRYSRLRAIKLSRRDVPTAPLQDVSENTPQDVPEDVPDDEAETIRIVPLSQEHLDRWRASGMQPSTSQPEKEENIQSTWQQQPASTPEQSLVIAAASAETGIEKETASTQSTNGIVETQNIPSQDEAAQSEATAGWLQRLQHFFLGQQQRSMFAAAIIESPLSVQPDQMFRLRIQIMGRDEPITPLENHDMDHSSGLGRLVNGDTFTIEVRAVLNQNFTFVVQRTTATIPATGYIAEILLPIKPYSNLPDGMRERLLISFLDKQHQPLYEKPFMVEIFVSQYVKRGREGYHVLTITQ
ncbi:MAG: protein kinase domain-containing protein [Ktedonobacteraceae bacterium]